MSQMYRVTFQVFYENVIDTGDYIICASSQEMAADAIMQYLELPRSRTRFEVVRVRPGIYEISRKEIDMPEKKSTIRHYHDGRDPEPVRVHKYSVHVAGIITARNENNALNKLVKRLSDSANEKRMVRSEPRSIGLYVECKALDEPREIGGMAAVETYQPKHFIGGMRGGNSK